LIEVIAQIQCEHVCFVHLECIIGPSGLLVHEANHHLANGNAMTVVTGLPPLTTGEIYSAELLRALGGFLIPGGPREPRALVQALATAAAVSGQPPPCNLSAVPFDAARHYGFEPHEIPQDLFFGSLAETSRLRSLDTHLRNGDDDIALLRSWKRLAVEQQERCLDGATPAGSRGRRPGRIRILWVSLGAAYCGAQSAIVNVVRRIDRREFEVSFVVGFAGLFTERLTTDGFHVICPDGDVSRPTLANALWWASLLRRLEPDIIHLEDATLLQAVHTANVIHLPIVQQIRIADVSRYYECATFASAVVAPSEYLRQQICQLDVSPHRVHVILDCVSQEDFEDLDPSAARAALAISPQWEVITVVARFAPQKRHDLAIDVLSRLASNTAVRLAFAGDAGHDGPYYDRLRKSITERGLSDRVLWLGFQRDIKRVLAATDIFLSCGDREGLGFATLEAMASGLPVVARGGAGAGEATEDGVTGFVVSADDGETLVHAAKTLVEDPGLRRQFGMAGRDRCRELFNPTISAQNLMALYHRVLRDAA
jgi:glycosyltransferase involved in cell wall biosynthesis